MFRRIIASIERNFRQVLRQIGSAFRHIWRWAGHVWHWAGRHQNAVSWMIVGIIVLLILWAFSSGTPPVQPINPTSPEPKGGYFFLKLAFWALVISAVVSYRYNSSTKFPIYLLIGAGIILATIIGHINNLFGWSVLGLPLFAIAGIWGVMKTEGRIKAFLGFASGIIILFWMFLIYLDYSAKIEIGFLKTMFPDDTAKVIFTIFLAVFFFATWKRSRIFYLISFIVFLSFLGNTMIDQIASRYPTKLTPSVPASIAPATSKISGAFGKMIDAFSIKLNANAERDAMSARQHVQTQRTFQIPAGTTVIYDCQNAECSPKSIPKYDKPTEIVSLNDSVESKSGIIYEKFSFPDPDTGQPGKFVGYIPTGKFSEKEEGNESSLVVLEQKYTEGSKSVFGANIRIPRKGTYLFEPLNGTTIYDSNEKVAKKATKEGIKFNKETDITIISRSSPIKVTRMK